MAQQPPQPNPADQFSDQDMEQLKHYGEALGGNPTAFEEAVEHHLNFGTDAGHAHEASYEKMRTAQEGLAPSDIEQAQMRSGPAVAQKQAQQSAQAASQAQAAQVGPNAPPAPSGPVGTTEPFAAQQGVEEQPQTQDVEPEVPGIQGPASQVGQPPAAPGAQEQS